VVVIMVAEDREHTVCAETALGLGGRADFLPIAPRHVTAAENNSTAVRP
jgi:hypothetical protein